MRDGGTHRSRYTPQQAVELEGRALARQTSVPHLVDPDVGQGALIVLSSTTMDDTARHMRADQRRQRAVLQRTHLGAADGDAHSISGADALSLVTQLTRHSWSLTGQPWPEYRRADTPYRFVPGPPR